MIIPAKLGRRSAAILPVALEIWPHRIAVISAVQTRLLT